MQRNLNAVFNPYNVNILFTVHTLPSKVSQNLTLDMIQQQQIQEMQKNEEENRKMMPYLYKNHPKEEAKRAPGKEREFLEDSAAFGESQIKLKPGSVKV